MATPLSCPLCSSTDLLPSSRRRFIPVKCDYVLEEVFLCDLGHMFTLCEQSETDAAASLQSTGQQD